MNEKELLKLKEDVENLTKVVTNTAATITQILGIMSMSHARAEHLAFRIKSLERELGIENEATVH
jgi:hypothetical protein